MVATSCDQGAAAGALNRIAAGCVDRALAPMRVRLASKVSDLYIMGIEMFPC